MSYQVLARKWRPAKFEQMVGQSHVLLALTNALSQQRLHHAYLFTGTRGVGKTSLARLFAKGLNCEQGVTANPCGVCSSCEEIAQGRFVDLIEVDAASRTKVDDTRELLDNVQYRPSRGRYKVYLIDEVHMLSRSSFNALLKTLEEPPEHVKFLLATTDPQKLPVTVLSRCLQFNLKSLSQDEIAKQLDFVLTQEQLPHEPQALTLLAKAANGSMRDALSLTDQAIAFGSGQVMHQQVQSMLGSIDDQQVIALLKALCDADIAPLMQTVAKVLAFGADAQEVLRSLLELLHQITLTQFAPAAAQASLYSEQILAFAQQLAPEQVQLYYQMLLAGRKDLPFAPDPKSGLEMALLRAVAFVPEKQTKRWLTQTPAQVDLNSVESPQVAQEVIETCPKLTADKASSDTQKLDSAVNANAPIKEPMSVSQDDDVHQGSCVNQDSGTVQVSDTTQANDANQVLGVSDAVEDKPNAEDSDVQDDISDLVAQQAILLDQAQSLGYQQFNAADEIEKPSIDVVNKTSEATDVNPSQGTQVSDNEADSVDELASADELDLASEATKVPSLQSDQDKSNPLDAASVATTDLDSDNSYQPYDEMSLSFSADEQDNDDHYDDYAAYTQQQPVANIAPINNVQTASSQPSSSPAVTDDSQSAEDPLDDILDMVIASRNSLLADVNALKSTDESAAKSNSNKAVSTKPEATARPKPEVKQAPAVNQQPIVETVSHKQPTTQGVEQQPVPNAASLTETGATRLSSGSLKAEPAATVNAENASYDRPPWEAPSEAEIQQREKDAQSLTESSSADVNNSAVVEPDNANIEQLDVSAQTSLASIGHQINGNQLDLDWYKIMAQVKVGGRVRQLGVNSLCEAIESPLKLLLKPDQKHLSADVAIEQLQQALSSYLATDIQVEIEVGQNPARETPLELRKRFHRELVQQAQQSILADSNVQWMINHLAAQLDQDSIVYPAEQLSGVAEQIPARLN